METISECFRTRASLVRSYLRRLVPPQDVDDVTQVVFAEAWRSRNRFDPARSPEAWLPAAQREAIALAYYGELSRREIAERLHVPLGTVKARTARGLHRLHDLLAAG
ncbi:sigma factor-like helix-turn-helix DNA-binding protein [Nonomuraea angiospora]|uniref:RNA polymerase sigma factor n=1 Tax=Nonomuraea angiospora TaxID=46172 RepID=UPI00344FCE60